MKNISLSLALISTISFANDKLSVSSNFPVYGEKCTIHIDMKTSFSNKSGLRTFGGAGSEKGLEDIRLIKRIIESRGYTIVESKEDAEFSLETSNGIQCVILEDGSSSIQYRLSELLSTDFYLSGRFTGDGVENTFFKTSIGLLKKNRLKNQVKKILNYCQKKY